MELGKRIMSEHGQDAGKGTRGKDTQRCEPFAKRPKLNPCNAAGKGTRGKDTQRCEPFAKRPKLNPCNAFSRIPPGWLDCHPADGNLIDFILPSKVPLGEAFSSDVLPGDRYTIQKTHEGRILGLVIDLTNEIGYYSILELNIQSIKHVKIPCNGVDSVPDKGSVNLFVSEIWKFSAQQQNSKKYLLVHCDLGHNRTGYMIVHYLVSTKQLSVTQAIKIFADARPPGIYEPKYIDSLYDFYHERKPSKFVCPPKPDWKRPAEFDLNVDATEEDGDNTGGLGMANVSISPVENKKEPMKHDDVIGDNIPFHQEFTLRKICYELLKLPVKGKQYLHFPGSRGAPLNKKNIELLRQQHYYATWNAEGTRYMMLITVDGCYLIDHKFQFRRVQMRFPSVFNKPHHLTLLDGEMIVDTVKESGKQVRRYLVYDIMAINSISLLERQFCDRWEIIDKDVIQPRNHERQHIKESKNPNYRYDLEPFRVRRKDFWKLPTVSNLFKDFIPRLSHKGDGLVFQGWLDPYIPHTNRWLLKWQNAEKSPIDFLYELVDDDHLLYVYDKGEKKFMSANRIIFQEGCNPSEFSGKIIECRWDNEKNMWIFIRIRSDKSHPSAFSCYTKLAKRITDNISEDILVNEIGKIVSQPNYA